MSNPLINWLTTEAAADALGLSRASVWRACRSHLGFAVRLNGSYRIPVEHIRRVKAGETAAQIAADVRSSGGDHKAA